MDDLVLFTDMFSGPDIAFAGRWLAVTIPTVAVIALGVYVMWMPKRWIRGSKKREMLAGFVCALRIPASVVITIALLVLNLAVIGAETVVLYGKIAAICVGLFCLAMPPYLLFSMACEVVEDERPTEFIRSGVMLNYAAMILFYGFIDMFIAPAFLIALAPLVSQVLGMLSTLV